VSPLIAWNPPLALAIVALITSQMMKGAIELLRNRRFDFRRMTTTGGMPSSHAASVSALATGVGLHSGWDSPLFGVAAFFSAVVMYDAAGIRRAAGLQAGVLNRMLEDLREHHTIEGERLKELLGHTPVEVFAGAAYGILLAVALYQ
jgi:uncharacterized protein